MSGVHFDLNGIAYVQSGGIDLEGRIEGDIHSFEVICQKAEREMSSFNTEGLRAVNSVRQYASEVEGEISDIRRKKANAESQKQSEKPLPQRPSVPSNATPEQQASIMSSYQSRVEAVQKQNQKIRQENEKIDAYKKKCDEAISKLCDLLEKLHKIEVEIKSSISQGVSAAHEFLGKGRGIVADNSSINSAIKGFNDALKSTLESAQKMCLMEPTKIKSYSYVERQFVIKNNHYSVFSSQATFTPVFEVTEKPREEKPRSSDKKEEILIRERQEDAFFESIEGAKYIKMPSANLHKLGGKSFISKMNEKGYELVAQTDGSTVDINGMLHWEKKDV